jgi:hypothetical protein
MLYIVFRRWARTDPALALRPLKIYWAQNVLAHFHTNKISVKVYLLDMGDSKSADIMGLAS